MERGKFNKIFQSRALLLQEKTSALQAASPELQALFPRRFHAHIYKKFHLGFYLPIPGISQMPYYGCKGHSHLQACKPYPGTI